MAQGLLSCSCNVGLEGAVNSMLVFILTLQVLSRSATITRAESVNQLPLSTTSNWIVDRAGQRVKLACVNWAGHMEASIPEGLSKASANNIARTIVQSRFNCVRLTSATWLWTDDSLGSMSVDLHFTKLNLTSALIGITMFNPSILLSSLREVHRLVVDALANNGLMVILDNHVSKPQWCCTEDDGNGFWGDEYFDPDTWLQGLTIVANMWRNTPQVVAMSMRNELRGMHQNTNDWFVFMQRAVDAVHAANFDVLLIVGGLQYATDLGMLYHHPLDTSQIPNKLVYEFHWYKRFAESGSYDNTSDIISVSEACDVDKNNVQNSVSYLTAPGQPFTAPLFLSEFGVYQADPQPGDIRFLTCVLDFLQQGNEGWALWALQGSYYLRNNTLDFDETFGLLTSSWNAIRNPSFLSRLQSTIQNGTRSF